MNIFLDTSEFERGFDLILKTATTPPVQANPPKAPAVNMPNPLGAPNTPPNFNKLWNPQANQAPVPIPMSSAPNTAPPMAPPPSPSPQASQPIAPAANNTPAPVTPNTTPSQGVDDLGNPYPELSSAPKPTGFQPMGGVRKWVANTFAGEGTAEGIDNFRKINSGDPALKEEGLRAALGPEDYTRVQRARGVSDQLGNFTNDKGEFDLNKTLDTGKNWFNSNVADPLKDVGNTAMSGNYSGVWDWIKNNKALAGGTGLVGALGVGGITYLLSKLFGGGNTAQNNPQNMYYTGARHPQAFQPYGMEARASLNTKLAGSFTLDNMVQMPGQFAGMFKTTNEMPPPQDDMAPPSNNIAAGYHPNIVTEDPRLKQLMASNPKMRNYITNLIQDSDQRANSML